MDHFTLVASSLRIMDFDDAEERSAAGARWRALSLGCSRPIRPAMEAILRLGELGPEAWNTLVDGLRQAMPILVRMMRADPPPRMVEEVLALWVREAEANLHLNKHTAAGLGCNPCASPSAAPAGADDGRSVFSEMPALEHLLFNVDMRASARGAPLGVRRVLHAAMVATLEQVCAGPNDVGIRDALVLLAFQEALRRAKHTDYALWRAVCRACSRGERIAAAQVALRGMAKTREAFTMAACHGRAGLAARGAASAPPGGPESAPRSGGEPGSRGVPDVLSEDAGLADLAAWVASAEAEYDGSEAYHHVRNEPAEEYDEAEAVLNQIDGQRGAELTSGRNTCAGQHHHCPVHARAA